MGTLIVHPDSKEKLTTLKALLKALKISFEEEKSPYNAEFVEKINRSKKDFNSGRYAAIKTTDLWK